ncbi:hypothetical protein MMC32_004480 [Xylographa parallela]|nr:hypothetical protein [Xylographa parallela]
MTLRQVQNDIIAIIKQCTGQKKLAGEREVRRDVAGNTLWYHLWVTGSPNRPDYHFEEAIPYPEQAQVQAPPPIRPPSPEIPGVPPPPGSPPGPSQPQQVPEIQPQEPPGTPPHPLQAPAQQPGFASYYRSSPRPPPIPEQADLAAAIPQSPPGARLSSAHSDPGLHTDDAPTLSQIRGNRGMRHAASAADLRAAESYHDLQRIVIEQVGNVEAQIGQLMTRVVPAPTPSPDRHAWDDENVGECVKRLWVAYVTHGRACDECVRENPGCFGALTCLGLLGLTAGVGGFIHSWIPSHH